MDLCSLNSVTVTEETGGHSIILVGGDHGECLNE